MTVEQAIGLIAAVTALAGAVTAAVIQLRGLRSDLNGHLAKYVTVAEMAALKQGELLGRDFVDAKQTVTP